MIKMITPLMAENVDLLTVTTRTLQSILERRAQLIIHQFVALMEKHTAIPVKPKMFVSLSTTGASVNKPLNVLTMIKMASHQMGEMWAHRL
jgi:hypothetical protein